MKHYIIFFLLFAFAELFGQSQFAKIADSLCKKKGYDYISAPEYSGMALIRKNGGVYYHNTEGKKLNNLPFEEGDEMQNGYAAVMRKGKWGVIDSNMQVIIDFQYSDKPDIGFLGIVLTEKEKKGFYHYATAQKTDCVYEDITEYHHSLTQDDYVYFQTKKTILWKHGKDLSNAFEIAASACRVEGNAIIAERKEKEDAQYSLYDFTGKRLVEEGTYEQIGHGGRGASNGFIAVVKNHKIGWIDDKGKVIFPPSVDDYDYLKTVKYDEMQFFSYYLKVMQNDTIWEDIKEAKVKVTDFPISKTGINEASCVQKKKDTKPMEIQKKVGLIDTRTFQLLLPIQYKNINLLNYKYWAVQKNDSILQLFSLEGKWIHDFEGSQIELMDDKYLVIHRKGKSELVDFTGQKVLARSYAKISQEGHLYTGIDNYNWEDEGNRQVFLESKGKFIPLTVPNLRTVYTGKTYNVYAQSLFKEYNNVLDSTVYVSLNDKGKISPLEMTAAFAFHEYLVYEYKGKWTIKDQNGKVQNIPQYKKIYKPWNEDKLTCTLENDSTVYYDKNLKLLPAEQKGVQYFEQEGLYGYKNAQGKDIIPAIFKEKNEKITTETRIFPLEYPDLWGICDSLGNVVEEPQFYDITDYYNIPFLYLEKGIQQYIDLRTHTKYKRYYGLESMYDVVMNAEGKVGILDGGNGNVIFPFIYDKLYNVQGDSDSLMWASLNDKWGIVNRKNEVILPIEYIREEGYYRRIYFDNGRIIGRALKKNAEGKYAFFNTEELRFVTDFVYDNMSASGLVDGYIAVQQAGKWGLINDLGQVIIPCKYPNFIYIRGGCTSPGYYSFQKNGNLIHYAYKNKQALYSLNGKELMPYQVQDIQMQETGNFYVINKDKKVYYTPSGKKLNIDIPKETKITDFHEMSPYLRYKQNDLWGIIDTNFQWKVPATYVEIKYGYNHNRYYVETVEGKKGMMDSLLNWVWKAEWDDIDFVSKDSYILTQNGKMGLRKTEGTWIIPLEYDAITEIQHGVCIVSKNKKCALADSTGKLLSDFVYDGMSFLDKYGYGTVSGISIKVDCLFGLMDYTGKVRLAPQFDMISNNEGLLVALKDNLYGVISDKYELKYPCKWQEIKEDYQYGGAVFKITENDLVGLLNQKGELLLPPIYKDANMTGDYFNVTNTENQTALIDKNGTIIIDYGLFDDISYRDAHTWRVKKNGHSYIVDKQLRYFGN